MSVAPIGIFDSGAGGLSILSGIHQLLPAEQLLYVADTAHAPYGPKGESYIRARCEVIVQFFCQQQVKAVVVACNTATAAAIADLRARYQLPIIGVEPAVKPAASQSKSGVVGVLATRGTISSEKFLNLQNRFNDAVEIISSPCPGLVEQIENLQPDAKQIQQLLRTYIEPMLQAGADTLVLGCTHYSLIKQQIQQVAGSAVAILDAGDAVAKELQRRLSAENLLSDSGAGSVQFFSSGDVEQQQALLGAYWGSKLLVKSLLPA